MRCLIVFLAIPGLAFQAAQPTARDKARELLDGVFETSASAQPEVAASALLRASENYEVLDHKKAIECMRQAFAITLAIPASLTVRRERVQSLIAVAAAPLSLPDAIAMVKQIEPGNGYYDPRQPAINAIVTAMIEKKQLDEAIELINSVGAAGLYPFEAARRVFEKLPGHDGRRLAIFAYAMSAYGLRPGEEFDQFLIRHWKELPRTTAVGALDGIIRHLLDPKTEDGLRETIGSSKGTLTLNTRQDIELFDLMPLLRTVDRARAGDILDTHPELKAAIQRFPNGRAGMGRISSMSRYWEAKPAEEVSAAMNSRQAQVAEQLEKFAEAADDNASQAVSRRDLLKALDIVKSIPSPESRVEALAAIAGAAAADDPETARAVLGECLDILKDVPDPGARVLAWNAIIDAAHEVQDDTLVWYAIDHALADGAELYKRDTDSEKPNPGLRDQWPSVNAYRHVVITVAKVFGLNAEPLLARITDPDLALFARVELAQTWLDRPHESWETATHAAKK